ncbi:DUF309 domain-containing protein [Leptothoe sp. PORK10 BA2]|uniref:DUF309 domain-containing protein n=1 Tax=Leptothoe sp. PORK10 BA2 TaxID=3110254 RepID=UPI002B21E2F7|nr:DUF309 domain-containing protein [Leptothoe sp. PORK10 BA2]MEA5462920.1 DUF309 domain-containing protein [Leptothoe sp. PORK10 BA2]
MTDSVNSSISIHQPTEFWLGVEQFNQRNYYACHDTLEAIWIDAKVSEQGFYQGILQIAVGFYHLGNLNWRGSAILLGEGSHRLDAYGDVHGGINVTDLATQSLDWLTALQATGPDQIQQLASVLSGLPLASEPYRLASGETLIPPTIHLA